MPNRSHRKRKFVSSFIKDLNDAERKEFENKSNGLCGLLRFVLADYIREMQCSISEAPDFCFYDGSTSRDEPAYSPKQLKIYVRERDKIIRYDFHHIFKERRQLR